MACRQFQLSRTRGAGERVGTCRVGAGEIVGTCRGESRHLQGRSRGWEGACRNLYQAHEPLGEGISCGVGGEVFSLVVKAGGGEGVG